MSAGLTLDHRALWLAMLRDGKWWSVAELTRLWEPTFSPDQVQDIVLALSRGGFVERRECGGLRSLWAVTDSCNMLPGIVRGIVRPVRRLAA